MAKFHTKTGLAFSYKGKQLVPEVVKQDNGTFRLVFSNVGDDFFDEHEKLVKNGTIVVIEHGDYVPEKLVTDEDLEDEWGEPIVVFNTALGLSFGYNGKKLEPELIEVDGKKRLQFKVGHSFLDVHAKLVENKTIIVTSEETYLDEKLLDDFEWLGEQVKKGLKPGQIAKLFKNVHHLTVSKKIKEMQTGKKEVEPEVPIKEE